MSDTDKLPPGERGLPFVGETLPALSNMYAFLEGKRQKHGNVFRSHILGRNVVIVSGPEGASAFLDQDKVTREKAHPSHVRELFGGINMNMFDGPRHAGLKSIALQAFDHRAIASYLPAMQALVESRLADLAKQPEIRGVDALRQLAIEAICKNVLDLDPGPQTDQLREDYIAVANGMLSLPLPLPGTTFRKAGQARDRILAFFRQIIAERRANPRSDGLSRMLQARTPEGVGCTDEEAMLELHHVVIAGYIVYGLLIELLLRLHRQPDLRQRALDEVSRVAPAGPLDLKQLIGMDFTTRLVREAKRTAPVLPLVFGRARRRFEVGGYTIPEGWDVWWGLSLSNMDPALWTEPRAFDPDRYAEGRAEDQKHEHAWTPQGSGPLTGHKCLGFDYSAFFAQVFLVAVLRGYTWDLPEQSADYHWNRTPAEPRDGLRMSLLPRS
jgi:cytochrome P450